MEQIPWYILLLVVYLLCINLFAVVLTVLDKYKAQRHLWRVKESTLLWVSAIGGSVFMYGTMHIVRHKTKKLKFMLGIPLIIVLQVAAGCLIWWLSAHQGYPL